MREIKFRGKRKDNGKWVHGSLFRDNFQRVFIIEPTNQRYFPTNFHEVIPETVGQYTGIKDKSGKEIYEGDIIGMNNEAIGVVKWENFTSRFIIDGDGISGLRRDEIKAWGWEVIGNTYENPELIEKVEE